VKGEDINPLYRFLTTKAGFDGEIAWNFNKFLVDRSGKVVARYNSGVKPTTPTSSKRSRSSSRRRTEERTKRDHHQGTKAPRRKIPQRKRLLGFQSLGFLGALVSWW